MSPISSNTVFHFTRRLDDLVSILTDEFRPHYAVEDLTPLRVQAGDGEFIVGLQTALGATRRVPVWVS